MEKFKVNNSYYETIVAYNSEKNILYIKVGVNNKVYEYNEVTSEMYEKICFFNNELKPIGKIIIYLNDNDSFGKEVILNLDD